MRHTIANYFPRLIIFLAVAIGLPAIVYLATTPNKAYLTKSKKANMPKDDKEPARQVSSLFQSPEDVAADRSPRRQAPAGHRELPRNESSVGRSIADENPFVIGSKRDPSIASSIRPAGSLPVAGDNEDRVRIMIRDNEAQFTFNDEGKRRHISLVGSFNSWNSNATPMRRENRHWKVSKRLAAIRHEFKFVSGNGDWYPEGDNLILDLQNREGVVQSNSFDLSQRPAGSEARVEVTGDHQDRVEVIPTKKGVRFLYRDPLESDYVLLVGDFNSWNTTVAGMRREGSVWTAEKAIAPGNYAFKFLGPGERWFPQGDNLTLSYSERVPATRSLPESTKPSTSSSIPATTESRNRESDQSISIQRAREYLNDAGLYEGKPGVWFFPQSNRLVIRQYGRISKDPKIKKALKRLGDRLPHPAEMENPPPQRR